MAYTELVKNFNRIRDYMREFYVYGFKSREEYTRKSARSYDDERRRIESWLGDYMRFRRTAEGKNVFLSIDSRISHHNPLYKAWKTKSFTDGDITLHFVIMDIMEMTEEALPVSEIAEKIDEYLSAFPEPRVFDESTVRKKLKEYVKEGLLETEKHGKILYYKNAAECDCYNKDILDFFSETAPCGVIGSFLLDRRKLQEENQKKKDSCQRQKYKEKFAFKHHYITSAIDSEILCQLFQAIHEKRSIIVETIQKEKEHCSENKIIPYLHDVEICQRFARRNREKMAEIILERANMTAIESFHTIHNYIDTEEMILRKGAIAAHAGEKVLIPINMRDGSVIAIGRGNLEWNYSAPHGAGRIMSRTKAKETLNMEMYKEAMKGIYTTSVNEQTIDEAPMAYKSKEDIIDVIRESVDIREIMKPVYNFKASGDDGPWKKKNRKAGEADGKNNSTKTS